MLILTAVIGQGGYPAPAGPPSWLRIFLGELSNTHMVDLVSFPALRTDAPPLKNHPPPPTGNPRKSLDCRAARLFRGDARCLGVNAMCSPPFLFHILFPFTTKRLKSKTTRQKMKWHIICPASQRKMVHCTTDQRLILCLLLSQTATAPGSRHRDKPQPGVGGSQCEVLRLGEIRAEMLRECVSAHIP